MLVLAGGEVIDCAVGVAPVRRRADVVCDGGRVVSVIPAGGALPAAATGAEVLDCSGLVVAPGFIDTHAHTDLALVSPAAGALPMKILQGVTTDVVGQDGLSVAPLDQAAAVRDELRWLVGDPADVAWRWRDVAGYLAAIDAARPALSAGYLVPHGALRTLALGRGAEARGPGADDIARMCSELRTGLAEGALGLSTGLIYEPCLHADAAELTALCREVAAASGLFAVHLRSESDDLLAATEEVLGIARASGVQLHLSHMKILGQRNVHLCGAWLELIEAARADGVHVTGDQYPYTASSTSLGQLLPRWAQAGGAGEATRRLGDLAERARIRRAIEAPLAEDGPSSWLRTGPQAIMIADVPSGRRPEVIGKNLAEAAQAAGQGGDVLGFVLDLLEAERLAVSMITFSQDEAVVERILKLPWVNLCTDGLLGGRPHPRTWGSFPRVLGRYVRERGVLSLEDAVYKLSAQAADAMRLGGRGRLVAGSAADVVVFDAARVLDVATYADPARAPVGIEHVVVAGQVAVRAGAATGVRAGAALRAHR